MILSNDKANPTVRLDKKSNVETPLLNRHLGVGWKVGFITEGVCDGRNA